MVKYVNIESYNGMENKNHCIVRDNSKLGFSFSFPRNRNIVWIYNIMHAQVQNFLFHGERCRLKYKVRQNVVKFAHIPVIKIMFKVVLAALRSIPIQSFSRSRVFLKAYRSQQLLVTSK